MAFVDFGTFAEAERVIRALNSDNNSGLGIKAEIANARRKSGEPKMLDSGNESSPEELEVVLSDEITFDDFSKAYTPIDYREKVTQFEYQQFEPKLIASQYEKLEQLAKESNWIYSNDFQKAQFNLEMRNTHQFPEFYCCRCNKVATMYDENSKKYFCSLSCFQNPMKLQEDTHVMLKKSEKVCITAIINEKCFFVRRSCDDLNHLHEQIYRAAKVSMTALQMVPNVGDEVLAKVFDGIFRAEVLKVIEEEDLVLKIAIRLCDIGSTTEVELENLFEMTGECKKFPSIVHKVFLKDVNVTSINMDVIEYLTTLRDTQKELIIKSIESGHETELELKDDEGNFVSQKITRVANFDKVNLNPTNIDALPSLQSSTGDNKKLFMINKKMLESIGLVWCLEEKFLKDFLEMQKSLNEYGKKLNLETYGANTKDLVLVKIKDQWFRAFIEDKTGDGKPYCCLIDICEFSKVPIEDIFVLPDVFTLYPMYSECYEVNGYLKASEKIKKFLNGYLLENNFIVADEVVLESTRNVIHFAALTN